jgi:hypothetical protein
VRFVEWDLGRLRLRGTVRHEVLLVRLVQLVDGKLHLYVISVFFAADDRVCHEPGTRTDSGSVGSEDGAAHCSSETVESRVIVSLRRYDDKTRTVHAITRLRQASDNIEDRNDLNQT